MKDEGLLGIKDYPEIIDRPFYLNGMVSQDGR